MKRDILKLDASRFTTTSACAREVLALLENSSYKIAVLVTSPRQLEELASELEDCKTLGRVSAKVQK